MIAVVVAAAAWNAIAMCTPVKMFILAHSMCYYHYGEATSYIVVAIFGILLN